MSPVLQGGQGVCPATHLRSCRRACFCSVAARAGRRPASKVFPGSGRLRWFRIFRTHRAPWRFSTANSLKLPTPPGPHPYSEGEAWRGRCRRPTGAGCPQPPPPRNAAGEPGAQSAKLKRPGGPGWLRRWFGGCDGKGGLAGGRRLGEGTSRIYSTQTLWSVSLLPYPSLFLGKEIGKLSKAWKAGLRRGIGGCWDKFLI